MRMRKKKHLAERLDAVSDYLFTGDFSNRNFNTAILDKDYINLDDWFGREAPLILEIGCGKGRFAVEYAKRHPEFNIIGIEKDSNVVVSACEEAKSAGLKNLKFMKISAEYIEKYIKPCSVDGIFLNFSCPFPKNKYASHRLTAKGFLEIYKRIMKKDAEIHQKTDNMHFFEFSIEQFSSCGFALKNISLDLHSSDFEGNIVTEYESRFVSMGMPIYRLEAYIK